MATLPTGFSPSIFVSDHSLAHQALVQSGSPFSDRPKALATTQFMSSNQHNITSASYGPTWNLLRWNLMYEILHPSRSKSFSHARKWALEILFDSLQSKARSGDATEVLVHFQYSMFSLLVFMCCGGKLNEDQIKEIEHVHRKSLLGFERFIVLDICPQVTKAFLRKRWEEPYGLRKGQEDVLVPLIRSRKKAKEERVSLKKEDKVGNDDHVLSLSYIDTLLDFELPDEKRQLDEGEIVTLASEFLNVGTDSTSTALLWIMANLVKYHSIQDKLFLKSKGFRGRLGRKKSMKMICKRYRT